MLLLAIYFFTLNIIHENKEYLYIFFKSKSFLEMCPILKTCKTIITFILIEANGEFFLKVGNLQNLNFFQRTRSATIFFHNGYKNLRMIDKKAKVLL